MQLIVELIGVEFEVSKVQQSLCTVMNIIALMISVPTLHTTCSVVYGFHIFSCASSPKVARRFWCSSPITSLSCTCGEQGCITLHTCWCATERRDLSRVCVAPIEHTENLKGWIVTITIGSP